jgi:CRISPR/Cas system-associated endoribonuclease Cas2
MRGTYEVIEEKDARIRKLEKMLRLSAERFRNPTFGCNWEDAAEDIERVLGEQMKEDENKLD